MNTPTFIRTVLDRRTARAAYWAADAEIRRPLDGLAVASEAAERARLLERCAQLEQQMADTYTAAYGPDPIEWEDGRDLAESMRHSAQLYRLLAAVEEHVGWGVELPRAEVVYQAPTLGAIAWPVLERIAAEPVLAARTVLLEELYEAVEPVVGGQAAEAIACLPSPGYIGWDSLRERGDWYAELPVSPAGAWAAIRTAALARLLLRLRGLAGLYGWIDAAPTEQLARVRAGAAAMVCARAGRGTGCPRCGQRGIQPAAGDAVADLGRGGVMRCERCVGVGLVDADEH